MKTFLKFIVFLGVVALTLAQYGIPDDEDDHLPPATFKQEVHLPAVASRLKVSPSPVVTSYTKYEDEEPVNMQSPKYDFHPYKSRTSDYAELAVTRTVVQPTRVEFRDESSSNHQPLVYTLRRAEEPTVAYPAKLSPSSIPSVPTQVRFTDTYSTQQLRQNEYRSADVVPIVKYVMDDDHRGKYRLETVTGDGTSNRVTGQLKDLGGSEGPVVVKIGSYSYTGDDGKVYQVNWRADEGGFQAFGDHLPKAPSPLN